MKWTNEARIGIVVFAAIAIFIGGVIVLRGIDLRSKKYSLIVFYPRVNGLRPGDNVTVAGLAIGNVEAMSLVEGKIKVSLSLQTKVQLPRDSKAVLKSETIMGGKFVEITPGLSHLYLQNGDSLSGLYEADLSELTATLSPISTNVLGILANVDSTLDEPTRRRIQEIVLNLGRTSARLEDVVSAGGSRLDVTIGEYAALARTLSNVANTLDSIASGQRSNIDSSVVDLKGMASNLNRVSSQLRRSAESLDTILLSIKEGKGTAGKLVHDEKLYNDIDSLAVNLNALVKDVRANPGRYFKMSVF